MKVLLLIILLLFYLVLLENHLFKDSKIVLEYNDGSIDEIYDIVNFMVQAKTTYPKIYDKLIIEINKHFDALKNSEKEDIKEQWPKKTAKEYMEEMVNQEWIFIILIMEIKRCIRTILIDTHGKMVNLLKVLSTPGTIEDLIGGSINV